MLIHHVETYEVARHEIDPKLGVVLRKERVVRKGGVVTIANPDFGTFEIQPDGSFDVPDELATDLCNQPGWFPGPNPFVDDDPAPKKPARSRTKTAA